jgi:DNA-binding transcriptional ArsR family regulator
MQKIEYTPRMSTSEQTITRQARLFKALMHPTRIAILEALRHSEECVCHLETHLRVRQAYLSQQLAVLRKAGLISDRRDGMNIFYRITQPDLLDLLDAARSMVGGPAVIAPHAASPHACPCPKCAEQMAAPAHKHEPMDRSI